MRSAAGQGYFIAGIARGITVTDTVRSLRHLDKIRTLSKQLKNVGKSLRCKAIDRTIEVKNFKTVAMTLGAAGFLHRPQRKNVIVPQRRHVLLFGLCSW